MSRRYPETDKVYPSEQQGMLSIQDMLIRFEKEGTTRLSDLHLKVGAPPTYRMDGELVKLKGPDVTPEMAKQLIYPMLSDENLQKFQSGFRSLLGNSSVDCSYTLGQVQFRINVFQENDGLAAAIRALPMDIPPVESIGFPSDVWKDIIDLKQGLVLVTGITGAGKSTTIASLLDRINQTEASRIITLEDPIEFHFTQKKSMISQREVGKDVKSFQEGLRAMLREDPDVIFVGEMRDAETVAMTIMAAETGHLAFSTLHTRDSIGTIMRITDYFPAERQNEVRNQLSLGLAYIINQKLIPRKDGTGRACVMEILNNSNYACSNLIRNGKVEQIYSQLQIKTGNKVDEKMITMEKHLTMLVKQGKVELEEAKKWVNNPSEFRMDR